ncbi:hydroxyisourate hydrolase [Nocardia arthritidis]|uniref:5-hydroxyisourate hydrolase n=1 Tax=Nocardia arthritidis TaxID=228602 RepID=A0A6G9YEJ4_9NOCA|nr:hydroxyisourate hydrolase [Nocardia arthritidis]QIS11705.1 hydroxyisourate hydrolase [Nocardia arthritidis]
MSAVTTHVLDTALGVPAAGVPVRLELAGAGVLGAGVTDLDGRIRELGPDHLESGCYRLVFDVAQYGVATGQDYFLTTVDIGFTPVEGRAHYHIPLLLSPFACSVYRGS